ncbi:putative transporter C11D3.18C [Mycena venus]|uniref:Putative transporter C11D3.18C n=1 Tax=Mycena venus TaxID=2733690 RepID=A0A8H6YIC7_9AGAR|nr:putative transporter C11D3.18C [Mycena venus]
MRAPFIAIQAMMTVAGMAVTGWAASDGARYFGLFLANSGASGCIPSILAYSSNNIVGHSKRAVLTTMLAASGSIGGVLASTAFREQDAPRYLLGIWVVIGVQFLTLSLLVLLSWHFARKNRLSREGKLDTPLEGQPGFFYTL